MKKLIWSEGYYEKTTYVAYVSPESVVAVEHCSNREFSYIILNSGTKISVGMSPSQIIKELDINI